MNIDLYLNAEKEVEREFMEKLAALRNEALENGMSEEQVSRILSVYAQGLLSEEFEYESPATNKDKETSYCPECGDLIENIRTPGIGEDPVIVPCGCKVDFDELPEEEIQDILK